jgi:S-DNA-T family DNA segregation ATPase FtsK/SpoIIIE
LAENDGDGYLPAVPEPREIEPEIVEGQVVDGPPPALPLRAVRVVTIVVRHEHARRAGRHLGYIPLGAVVVVRRLWESRTTAVHQQMIRAAKASGDQESALKWAELAEKFREGRHKRRVERREMALKTARALPWILLSLLVTPAVLGIMLAIATKHIAEVKVPFEVTADIVKWAVIAVSVSYGPVLLALPWIALAALWHVGRTASAPAGGWDVAGKDGEEDGGIVITADSIVLALQNTHGIPALAKAFKDGWRPVFHTLPVKDGKGYSAIFSVPMGVTAEMIADKRAVFGRNLHRAEIETWPTDAERAGTGPAGTVALWVADRGVLDRAAPEYPLLHEGTADVFAGVPGGVSPRGDALTVPLAGNNGVFGGLMGQGKSNACRVVMLGAALDPLAELIVHVFAFNGDFDAWAPRLSRYVKGAEDEQVDAAMETLHALYAEVGQREQMLADIGAKKVTRDVAQRYPELRPKIALFSECHELFGHKAYGEEATDLAVKTVRRARKTGIVTEYDTQDARKDAIPPKLVSLVSVNTCFAVKSWRANDGFLGDGSFAAGIRATELRPGRDKGRSLVTGVSDAQFELLKWYYIEADDNTGYDAATEVIARAMASVAPGTVTGANAPVEAIVVRDLLEDLAEVLGDGGGRVKLADLPARLRKLDPAWRPYRDLNGVQLRELLEREGVRVYTTGGTLRLDPADLRAALARRAAGG